MRSSIASGPGGLSSGAQRRAGGRLANGLCSPSRLSSWIAAVLVVAGLAGADQLVLAQPVKPPAAMPASGTSPAATPPAVTPAAAIPPGVERIAPPPPQPLPSPVSPAWSDPRAASTALEQARRLYAEGQRDSALKVIDTALQASPRDAALRFTRAVMLAEAGRRDEAMQGFTELTREFPELPEPHNNLATLHAARGELDQARAALDNAVRALPSYALAWENLGDVHLRIAERAWTRAAALDSRSAVQIRLNLARELIDRVSPAGTRPATVNPPARSP